MSIIDLSRLGTYLGGDIAGVAGGPATSRCRGVASGFQTLTDDGAFHVALFDTAEFDVGGWWTPSQVDPDGGTFIAPEDGLYLIEFSFQFSAPSATTTYITQITEENSARVSNQIRHGNSVYSSETSGLFEVNAGDRIRGVFRQIGSDPLDVDAASFSICKLAPKA